jgi:hypothetical protein
LIFFRAGVSFAVVLNTPQAVFATPVIGGFSIAILSGVGEYNIRKENKPGAPAALFSARQFLLADIPKKAARPGATNTKAEPDQSATLMRSVHLWLFL